MRMSLVLLIGYLISDLIFSDIVKQTKCWIAINCLLLFVETLVFRQNPEEL